MLAAIYAARVWMLVQSVAGLCGVASLEGTSEVLLNCIPRVGNLDGK